MVAEQSVAHICGEVDIDNATQEELREIIQNILKVVTKKRVSGFSDKHVGKPSQWDGEKEAEFKTWSEKFTSFMAGAGDKAWRTVLKELQTRDDDELDDTDDVEMMLTNLSLDPDMAEEMSETLYDQITQYTKGELLADIQMAGPENSMESYRKLTPMAARKKTKTSTGQGTASRGPR